jgi:hypothetical protein
MFSAHLSLGRNYAEFPYFYLKPPAGQCADLATKIWTTPKPMGDGILDTPDRIVAAYLGTSSSFSEYLLKQAAQLDLGVPSPCTGLTWHLLVRSKATAKL